MKRKYLLDQSGKPRPLTGVCTVCGRRVKITSRGMIWSHGRKKPDACEGSGIAPKANTVKRAWPSDMKPRSHKGLRTVPGGLPSLGKH